MTQAQDTVELCTHVHTYCTQMEQQACVNRQVCMWYSLVVLVACVLAEQGYDCILLAGTRGQDMGQISTNALTFWMLYMSVILFLLFYYFIFTVLHS